MKLFAIYESIKIADLEKHLSKILQNAIKRTYDDYRIVKPDIDASDFFIGTRGEFKNNGMSIDDFDSLPSKPYSSDSGSTYKIVNGILYRLSNHWGRVASCNWDISDGYNSGYVVGEIPIRDLKINDRPSGYIKYYDDALDVLKSAKNDMEKYRQFFDNKKADKIIDMYISRLPFKKLKGQ